MTALTRTLLRDSWRAWLSNDLRRVGPWWMPWLWTLLFCLVLAVVFTMLGYMAFARGEGAWRNVSAWLYWYGRNLIVCLTIGALIHLLFDGASRFVGPQQIRGWRPWQRTLLFSGLPLLGVALGWPLGVMFAGADVKVWISSRDGANIIVGSVTMGLLITFLLHHFFAAKSQQIEAERRVTETQLRLLQAQMEPHFLFNTLANVQSLIAHEPAKAQAMLESFTDYLRCTLTQLRTEDSTVGAELALAENYLRLLQTRMEDRLHYRIEADDRVRAAVMPPLMLQPLVENAIHHGLEPKVEGGTIVLRAQVRQRQLVLEVSDDGLGLDAPPRRVARTGNGVALANLRERLASRFVGDARLELADNGPGTRATIVMPYLPPWVVDISATQRST